MRVARGTRSLLALALLLATAACVRRPPPLGPGDFFGAVPDLRGARVMVFPVQSRIGVDERADQELAYALSGRGPGVDWVLPEEMVEAMRESPGLDTRTTGLPVATFLQAEVRRIGDPLFGFLRRMGALVGSDVAVVPVQTRYRPATPDGASGVEMSAALVAVRTGDVLWYGVVEGGSGAATDTRTLATAADEMSRRLLPYPPGS